MCARTSRQVGDKHVCGHHRIGQSAVRHLEVSYDGGVVRHPEVSYDGGVVRHLEVSYDGGVA